jgi:hypothetical protein
MTVCRSSGEEQTAWSQLWTDVAALVMKTQEKAH